MPRVGIRRITVQKGNAFFLSFELPVDRKSSSKFLPRCSNVLAQFKSLILEIWKFPKRSKQRAREADAGGHLFTEIFPVHREPEFPLAIHIQYNVLLYTKVL